MIPKNWSFVQLGSVTESQYGYTAKAIDDKSLPKLLRITDIQNGKVDWENVPNCQIDGELLKKYLLQDGDIVIARTGATTGKSYLLSNPINSVFASYLIRLRPSKNLNVKYLYYFLQSNSYWNQISELAVGIAQPGVNSSKLQRINFPLPPLDEQQRTVDIIENLFSKLDRAKDLAQNIIDSYELRRSAILNTVFNGSDNLEIKSLDECGTWSGGGTPSMKHKEYWENANILWVTPKDMKADTINNTQMKINSTGVENSSAKLVKNPSVLFVMRSGILRHTLPISMIELEFTCNQDLKVLTPLDKINVKYLMLACKANEKSILNNCMKNGTTVESINFDALKKFKIKITAIEEQKEIVHILDSLLAKEQRTKELAEQILQKIDLMKKAILARAFRGELNGSE